MTGWYHQRFSNIEQEFYKKKKSLESCRCVILSRSIHWNTEVKCFNKFLIIKYLVPFFYFDTPFLFFSHTFSALVVVVVILVAKPCLTLVTPGVLQLHCL